MNNILSKTLGADISEVRALADRIRHGDCSSCLSDIERIFRNMDNNNVWDRRFEFCRNISWSVPDESSVKTVAEFLKGETCVDYGSGLGLWSLLLQREGVDIAPVDVPRDSVPGSQHCEKAAEEFTPVSRPANPLAWASQRCFDAVFMSWPRLDCPETAKFLGQVKPRKLVFIGEGRGGCTGDDNLFDLMEDHFTEVDTFNVPTWFAIHDYGILLERR